MIDLDSLVLGQITSSWGEQANFAPQAGPQAQVPVVFQEKFAEIAGIQQGDPIVGNRPILGCRVSDLPQMPVNNDIFTLRGIAWRVDEVEPDGEGWVHIKLILASDTQRGQPLAPPAPLPPPSFT